MASRARSAKRNNSASDSVGLSFMTLKVTDNARTELELGCNFLFVVVSFAFLTHTNTSLPIKAPLLKLALTRTYPADGTLYNFESKFHALPDVTTTSKIGGTSVSTSNIDRRLNQMY